MSHDTIGCIVCVALAVASCVTQPEKKEESPVQENKCSLANYRTPYEKYCDSIREADPDYFYDVLVETDEFQEHLERNEDLF